MISENTMKAGNLSIYNYQIHKTIFLPKIRYSIIFRKYQNVNVTYELHELRSKGALRSRLDYFSFLVIYINSLYLFIVKGDLATRDKPVSVISFEPEPSFPQTSHRETRNHVKVSRSQSQCELIFTLKLAKDYS